MNNMRRTTASSPLRMSQGGMFDSLKRAVGVGPKETIQQKFAREDAALKAKMPAPAPAAAPAPPKAVSDYVGNSALERRAKAAGLRDGGDLRTGMGGKVPGSGSGDKIPAKYEPGEFVVSNDMLDAAPELRGQLHSLRGQVLAEKGMTPEQADAKALKGTGLRAQNGLDPYVNHRAPKGPPAMPAPPQLGYTPRAPGTALATTQNFTAGGSPQFRAAQDATRAAQAAEATSLNQAARAAAAGRAEARAASAAPTQAPRPGAPTSAGPAKPAGKFARGATAALRGAGAVVNNPVARTLLGAPAGIAVAGMTPTDMAPGTLPQSVVDAMKQPFDPNRAPMDFSNPVPSKELPGGVPVPMSGAGSDAKRASGDFSYTPVGPTGRPFSPDFSQELAGMPDKMPAGLRQGVVHQTLDENGRKVFSGSNIGPNAGAVDRNGQPIAGSGFGVSTMPGMPQAEIDATLNNPNGTRWSAADNAIMAANLRDGVDPYRGTSRSQGASNNFTLPDTGGTGLMGRDNLRERSLRMDASSSRNTGEGRRAYEARIGAANDALTGFRKERSEAPRVAAQLAADQQKSLRSDETLRRGQDMDLVGEQMGADSRERVAMAPALAAQTQRQRLAGYLRGPQGENTDPAQAAQRALSDGNLKAAEELYGMVDSADKRTASRNNAVDDLLKPLATYKGEDGKPGGVDDGLLQALRADLNSIATQMGKKSVEELMEDGPAARAAIATLQGMNSRKDNGFMQSIGFDSPSTRERQLPDFTGAQSERVGFWKGALTGGNVQKGDRKVSLRDGTVRYIPQETFADQDVQSFLRGRGLDK